TPRLGALKKGAAVAEQVMSRGTGVSRAAVVFSKWEAGTRVRYRACWLARRARESAGGRMQATERSIERQAADGDWDTLVSDTRGKFVRPVFKEVLEGFTPQDFQRSMLLAQGRVDAMLHARPEERAEILERLTNTAEYQALGERAARMRAAWKAHVAQRQAQVQAISPMEPEKLESARVEVVSGREALASHDQRIAQLTTWRAWLDQHQRLVKRAEKAAQATADVARQRTETSREMEALSAHERLEAGFVAEDALMRATREHEAASEKAMRAAERVPAAEEKAATAEEMARKASGLFEAVNAATIRLQSTLSEVHDAVATQEAMQRALDADRSRTAAAMALAEARTTELTAADARLQTARIAASEANEQAATCSRDAGLRDALTGLQRSHAAWARIQKDILQEQHQHERTRTEHQTRKRHHAERASEHETNAGRRLSAAEEEARRSAEARSAALGDDPAATVRTRLRAATEAAVAHQSALTDIHGLLAGLQKTESAVQAARHHLHERTIACRAATSATEEAARELAHAEAALVTAEAVLEPLQRIIGLSSERAQLVEGEACPLCGSAEHPFREDPVARARSEAAEAEADRARTARDASRNRRDDAQAGASGAQLLSARAEAEMQGARHNVTAAEQARDAAEAAVRSALQTHSIPDDDPARTLRKAMADAQAATDAARAEERAAAALLDEADTAARALAKVREETQAATSALIRDAGELKGVEDRLAAEAVQLGERRAAAAAQAARLVDSLADHGIDAPDPTLALQAAETRVEALRKAEALQDRCKAATETAEATATEARKAAAAAEAHLQHARSEEASASERLQQARAAEQTARAILTEAWSTAGDLDLPGSPPRPDASGSVPMLRAHQDEREAATRKMKDEAVAHAARSVAARDKTLGVAQTLASRAAETALAQQRAADALDAALATLAVASREALRAARIGPTRLAVLQTTRAELDKAETSSMAAAREIAAQQRQHQDDKPEGLPSSSTVESLDADIEAARSTRQTVREGLTQAEAILNQAASAEASLAEAQAGLAKAREGADVWNRLHDLIGKNDGGAFKLFAQALNLDQLLRSANRHLGRLNERYRLRTETDETGLPTLEFVVEDTWRPGTPRSIKTLSGGESFLVSLALALGLSDLRTSSMPVETLLLDEGFGTLDPQTLDTALAALQQLQSAGRQVGIISHVVGLQERIQARIMVEPIGEGRSKLRPDLRT
ncbi:MAG: SbcC/MukB-like Walker B domain-containing protein, partial [Myxococcota bacterium]|nr:SbcC/MukB-like Walker B domain-containing protein [Myxococcota bacterium]